MPSARRRSKPRATNKFLVLYRAMVSPRRSEAEIRSGLRKLRAAASAYTPQGETGRPLPFDDDSLDRAIATAYRLKIALEPSERKALVKLLVESEELGILKPWGGGPIGPRFW